MTIPPIPTADGFAALEASYRRDTASNFVALAYALLQLGRPEDAAAVCKRGLAATPESLPGRLYLGSALASLHRWKEAQAELLVVVKADRNSVHGFRILGETLMRRNDFARALPVLLHAQSLNPSDPALADMMRRAQAEHPLDPPAAVPRPVPPSGVLTAVPSPVPGAALGRVELQQRVVRSPGPVLEDQATPRVRPRVIPLAKPKDAAQAGLRASAAAGEQYLSQLLLGGLLDVPNVRIEEAVYVKDPSRRWGRSGGRVLVYLAALVLLVGAGSGAWYWYAERQVASDISRHIEVAEGLVESGDQSDLRKAAAEAGHALARDKGDVYAAAVLAEVDALSLLLYGDVDSERVQTEVSETEANIEDPAQSGYRELLVARSASTLAQIESLGQGARNQLEHVSEEITTWLIKHPEDHLVRWLQARAYLAAGKRDTAKKALVAAYADGQGPAIAAVDLADFSLDAGEYEGAVAMYDAVLERSKTHPLAFVGRSLARSERHLGAQEAMADISIGLGNASGNRLLPWKEVALAGASAVLGDYEAFSTALQKAETETGPTEPRFLARLGLALLREGRIADARSVRAAIHWYGDEPQKNPLVIFLDAELLMARGLPAKTLALLGETKGARAARIRGLAFFEMGSMSKAQRSLNEALAVSPDDTELQAWAQAAQLILSEGSIRRKADESLDSLGRKATTKTPRLIHGLALAAIGRTAQARDKLNNSLQDISAAFPSPLAYRAQLALAQIAFSKGQGALAAKLVHKALETNPQFFPSKGLLGQILAISDPAKSLDLLREVVSADAASAGVELAFARGLASAGVSPDEATEAIRRAQRKGASEAQLRGAIAAVDPSLFAELDIAPTP